MTTSKLAIQALINENIRYKILFSEKRLKASNNKKDISLLEIKLLKLNKALECPHYDIEVENFFMCDTYICKSCGQDYIDDAIDF